MRFAITSSLALGALALVPALATAHVDFDTYPVGAQCPPGSTEQVVTGHTDYKPSEGNSWAYHRPVVDGNVGSKLHIEADSTFRFVLPPGPHKVKVTVGDSYGKVWQTTPVIDTTPCVVESESGGNTPIVTLPPAPEAPVSVPKVKQKLVKVRASLSDGFVTFVLRYSTNKPGKVTVTDLLAKNVKAVANRGGAGFQVVNGRIKLTWTRDVKAGTTSFRFRVKRPQAGFCNYAQATTSTKVGVTRTRRVCVPDAPPPGVRTRFPAVTG